MKDEEVSQLMLEPAYTAEYLRNGKDCDPKIIAALEEWGVINRVGKRSKKKELSPRGIKNTLSISLSLEE